MWLPTLSGRGVGIASPSFSVLIVLALFVIKSFAKEAHFVNFQTASLFDHRPYPLAELQSRASLASDLMTVFFGDIA